MNKFKNLPWDIILAGVIVSYVSIFVVNFFGNPLSLYLLRHHSDILLSRGWFENPAVFLYRFVALLLRLLTTLIPLIFVSWMQANRSAK